MSDDSDKPTPLFPAAPGDVRGPYGFGRRSHGGAPGARYGFGSGPVQPLPLKEPSTLAALYGPPPADESGDEAEPETEA